MERNESRRRRCRIAIRERAESFVDESEDLFEINLLVPQPGRRRSIVLLYVWNVNYMLLLSLS